MGAESKIEWTDHTFNPWHGCTKVAPECEHCYAEAFAKRTGHDIWGPKAPRRFFGDKHWVQPFKWNHEAKEAGERRKVFCASMADFAEDRPDLLTHRLRLFKLIEATPWLDWLLLTKRVENVEILTMLQGGWPPGKWPPNVWLGVSAGTQKRANDQVEKLLKVEGPSVYFVSCEPLLEAVDLSPWLSGASRKIGWVIAGAESGGGARTMEQAWVLSLRDQCQATRTPFFYKQEMEGHRKVSLPMLGGRRWAEFPEVES